jgi:hypothetical protein
MSDSGWDSSCQPAFDVPGLVFAARFLGEEGLTDHPVLKNAVRLNVPLRLNSPEPRWEKIP